jgi:hypothetical protein
MINLHSQRLCDAVIKSELRLAGIPKIKKPSMGGEVPYIYEGLFENDDTKIAFRRAYQYWIIGCKMPHSEIMNNIYNNKWQNTSIKYQNLCSLKYDIIYHIFEQDGLNIFVTTLKKLKIINVVYNPIQNQFNNLLCKLI